MKVGIIDYGAGNVYSVRKALERCGVVPFVSANAEELSRADKIIFPGVGHALSALQKLEQQNLISFIQEYRKPFLGICLGMQLMGSFLEEAGKPGLNLLDAEVKKFYDVPVIPHMGWNAVYDLKGSLFKGIPENTDFYFVHSYAMVPGKHTSALCCYEKTFFTAAVEVHNFMGVQFHPEKSGKWGLVLLNNFLKET
ncbi:MAG: imidazole glycerol phosphate synthase subunit HisH [Bacteroidia bacterium]|nr:imidazole glycerol phosphate synthase subunit HisH [Bacteroidia bacterium]